MKRVLRCLLGFGAAAAFSCARTPAVPFPAGMANFHVLDDLEEQPSANHTTSETAAPIWLRDTGASLECSQHYCGPHLCSTQCWLGTSGDVDKVLQRLVAKFGQPQRSWGRLGRYKAWTWDWRPGDAGADEIFGIVTLRWKRGDPKGFNGARLLFESADGYPERLPGMCSCVHHYF